MGCNNKEITKIKEKILLLIDFLINKLVNVIYD
jgi:hypothetical protein